MNIGTLWARDAVRGAQWRSGASIMVALSASCARHLSGSNSPFELVLPRLAVSVILAYYLFAELPSHWTWLGATLIFASSYYVLYREAGSRTRNTG